MRPLEHIYNTLLTLGAIGTLPLWGALLGGRKRHRAGWLQKLTGSLPVRPRSSRRAIWYHAVSLGEVVASVSLIRELSNALPAWPLWVSTVTETGQAAARSKVPIAEGTFYLPFDHPWIVDRVIRRLRPLIFITMETEIWPNCVWSLKRRGVPVVLVNGRISDQSFAWYRRFRFLFREVLSCFDLLCAQSQQAADRLCAVGAPPMRVVVTGNMKFDQTLPELADKGAWREELGLGQPGEVLVAGSTHKGEEEIILRAFLSLRTCFPDLKLVIAPRSPERFDEVERLLKGTGLRVMRRSLAKGDKARLPTDVLLLDTIGELALVYGAGDVGFVGGSLVPHGGHNPLEIAAHRCPVLFGPHMENFSDVAAILLHCGGAMEVSDGGGLFAALKEILVHPERRHRMGEAAFNALISHRGAVRRTMDAMRPLLERVKWD